MKYLGPVDKMETGNLSYYTFTIPVEVELSSRTSPRAENLKLLLSYNRILTLVSWSQCSPATNIARKDSVL